MSIHTRRGRRKKALTAAGVVLLVCGVAAIVIGFRSQVAAPQPPASAAVPVAVTPSTSPSTSASSPAPSPSKQSPETKTESVSAAPAMTQSPTPDPTTSPNPAPTPTVTGPVLARSLPVHLSIPAIGVDSNLKDIGLEPNGEITTPPLVKDSHAYWLNVSPTPGQLGPSVILGHVDSAAYGPAVFFDLGKLRQRDTIDVTLADHTTAVFEVTHVDEYKKAEFPTQAVYGNTDHAALRLMTCGGAFDYAERSYESNIVVYAALVSSHPTR